MEHKKFPEFPLFSIFAYIFAIVLLLRFPFNVHVFSVAWLLSIGATVNVSIKEPIQRNMQQNVSVSVGYGRMNKKNSKMLWWELSAPCKLEGEVWPCHQENSCREEKGFRQQLESGTWKQNSKGLWVRIT